MPWETKASVHQTTADESRGCHIKAGSPCIIFKKEIKEVDIDLKQDFMVTHRYYRIDQYGKQNRSEDDDAVPSEFLVNVPYECEVIMTNVSPENIEFNLLYQVPIGSMPIRTTKFMKCLPLSLSSYSTARQNFHFYFPQDGKFSHYPSNVSINEKVTARGELNTLNVVKRRTIDKSNVAALNFDDLVQLSNANKYDDVLNFLKTKNILSNEKGFQWSKIEWLLKEKGFYEKAIAILRKREIYTEAVWKESMRHLDSQAIAEYMSSTNSYSFQTTGFIDSKLFNRCSKLRPEVRFYEYNPMINARAHKVGSDSQKNQILNKTFRQTYDKFLQMMAYKPELSFEDKMVFIYYLQLQDRIPEAIKIFNTLKVDNLEDSLRIQYDYLNAYFDIFTGAEDKYKKARTIIRDYDNHPVAHWKMMFLAIDDLLNDFDGEFNEMAQDDEGEDDLVDKLSSEASLKQKKRENMKKSKMAEPELNHIELDSQGNLTIDHTNIKVVKVKYYKIDAEILFSRAPFLKGNA